MRVAILGGTTFIGPAIVEALLAAGHEVVTISRGRRHTIDPPPAPARICDRRDEAALKALLAELRPEVLVDTCALDRAGAAGAVRALPAGTRAVVLSSMDVYRAFGTVLAEAPATDPLPLDETSPVRAERYPYRDQPRPAGAEVDVTQYEKLDVEEEYAAANAAVLRLPMVFGERDPKRREELLLRRVRARRRRIPIGAGTFLWTRGWVRDVAAAVRLAVERPEVAGVTLNVGERRTWTIRQWLEELLAAAEWEAELVAVPDERVPEDLALTRSVAQHLLVDSTRARATRLDRQRPARGAAGLRALAPGARARGRPGSRARRLRRRRARARGVATGVKPNSGRVGGDAMGVKRGSPPREPVRAAARASRQLELTGEDDTHQEVDMNYSTPESTGARKGSPLDALLGCMLLLALMVGALYGAAKLIGGGPAQPGQDAFWAANTKITSAADGVAFGNTAAAEQLARRFGEQMTFLQDLAFTGDEGEAETLLTQDAFVTHCEVRADRICFLVHVPRMKRYKGEVRDTLIDLAWATAQAVTDELRAEGDRKLAVALRGTLLYGGLAIGMGNGEPTKRENAGSVGTDPLYAFFAAPQAAKGQAAAASTEGGAR